MARRPIDVLSQMYEYMHWSINSTGRESYSCQYTLVMSCALPVHGRQNRYNCADRHIIYPTRIVCMLVHAARPTAALCAWQHVYLLDRALLVYRNAQFDRSRAYVDDMQLNTLRVRTCACMNACVFMWIDRS